MTYVQVGLMLLASTEESSRCSDSWKSSESVSGQVKKRGVRQMVKEIERSVRKLRVKSWRKRSQQLQLAASDYITVPSPDASASDVRVRQLVDKFDQSPVPFSAKEGCFNSSTPRSSIKNITDLVSPKPYKSPDCALLKTGVRRSQSERIGNQKHLGYTRSFRTTSSNLSPVTRGSSHPNLNVGTLPSFTIPQSLLIIENDSKYDDDVSNDDLTEPPKTPLVREMVEKIETRRLASVHRSSSMPSSAHPKSRLRTVVKHRNLRKAKSSPFLDAASSS